MVDDMGLSSADLLNLVESGRELSSEIDLDVLLQRILDRAGELTDSPAGSILLHDNDRGGLYFAAATGPAAVTVLERFGESADDVVPLYDSKAGGVYQSGVSLIVTSVVSDPEHFKGVDVETKEDTDSMVCVPLTAGAERLGVVQLINKRSGEYTDHDRVLLEHFAAQAAVAIRNASSFRQLLAHMGLYSSRSGQSSIQDLILELGAPAREERLSLLFADMRGFTRLSHGMRRPESTQTILNEFLELVCAEVLKSDGIVNKFLGDGLLALFRHSDTETRALRCAFRILAAFDEQLPKWDREQSLDLTFLDVGVGIVTDEVIIGSVGSPDIRDFTVIGPAVNLGAALEEAARGGMRVLVDSNTFVATEHIVGDYDGPVQVDLAKDDQPEGHIYKRYHIKSLDDIGRSNLTIEGGPPAVTQEQLSPFYQDSWAVVVGIDTYQSTDVPQLSYAVADAELVADALPDLGFPSDHIRTLIGSEATREGLHVALYNDIERIGEDDRFFVFLALHGQKVELANRNEGFLLTYDADPSNLFKTAFPMSELAKCGERLPAKHVLFALDCCFSGFAARRSVGLEGGDRSILAMTHEPVVQVMTAGTSGQPAVEDGGNGIFTRYLLEGLHGSADSDRTGLTALKLGEFVQSRVSQRSDGRQLPQISKLDGEGEFLFRPPGR